MNTPDRVITLKVMLGDYPITHRLRSGQLDPRPYAFEFADVKVPNTAFKRVVRDLEFDVAELAIVTFLQALDAGIPLVLLPAVIVSRFQHPFLMYDSRRGELKPADLRGKRIGVRSYCVTTVTWLRGMLQGDHGIEPRENQWITFEDAHVAQWRDPPWAQRADASADMLQMLEAGELDAAVLGAPPADKPHIKPVFANPEQDSSDWYARHQVIQINHMIVLKPSVVDQHPDLPRALMTLLAQSRGSIETEASRLAHPAGLRSVRPHLEYAIDMVHRQGLTQQRRPLESLFHPATLVD